MKEYGKVEEYNGVYGTIKGNDGIDYTLLDKNIIDENVQENVEVEFEKDNYRTVETEVNIARFVRKRQYNNKQ